MIFTGIIAARSARWSDRSWSSNCPPRSCWPSPARPPLDLADHDGFVVGHFVVDCLLAGAVARAVAPRGDASGIGPGFGQRQLVAHCFVDRALGGFRLLLGPRVRLVVSLLQSFGRHVRVNLGRRETGVPEHTLHAAEVGAGIKEVGGETVAEFVRASRNRDLRESEVFLTSDQIEVGPSR